MEWISAWALVVPKLSSEQVTTLFLFREGIGFSWGTKEAGVVRR
jgi:hypothetical protein